MALNVVDDWTFLPRKGIFWIGYCLLAIFIFSSLLIVNILIVFGYPLHLINPKFYRQYCDWFGFSGWPLYPFLLEMVGRNEIHFYGENVPNCENAIVIENHQSYADWIMVFALALRKQRIGCIKIAIKDVLRYIPAVGTSLMGMGFVFLSRNWEKDRRKLSSAFAHLCQFRDVPFWFMSHPEGSRASKSKIQESQDFAKKRDLPVLQHVLLPRVKGFVAAVGELRGNTDAVYDITTIYSGKPTQFVSLFSGINPIQIHMLVRRYPIKDIPKDETELSNWLYQIYKEKDEAMDYFKKNGKFKEKEFQDPINRAEVYNSLWNWVKYVYIPGGIFVYFLFKTLINFIF